ncbi:MAG: tRNA(5-methylaminomethyl-2-thiouridylate) methyltransferase [Desulfovibrio sp.]|nr:tRNA(5-methylaminomethyl-2-thiouridylate) methyltransferase [Desulfovibrio sp.]
MPNADCLVLFSGGLDSILAALVLQEQGLSVTCVHMYSPFFGNPARIPVWEHDYGLSIVGLDMGEAFATLLRNGPAYGFGKTMNPCVDCKILMLQTGKSVMEKMGAKILATGEVLGQRPMSQRSDVLNTIEREAHVKDCLVRPLSAKHLAPSQVEERGWVKREALLGIGGRGRKEQLRLAALYQLPVIPTPAGGCKLTERENVRRYYPVLCHESHADAQSFALANCGRQFWYCVGDAAYWLTIGRNAADNEAIAQKAREDDLLLTFPAIPSPVALARHGTRWPKEILALAGSLSLSYAVSAIAVNPTHSLCLFGHNVHETMVVTSQRESPFALPAWEKVGCALAELRKKNA